jgi:hypothetical protein
MDTSLGLPGPPDIEPPSSIRREFEEEILDIMAKALPFEHGWITGRESKRRVNDER